MYRLIALIALLSVSLVHADALTTPPALSKQPGEPIAIFNGKDLDGWVWFAKPPTSGPAAAMGDVWSVKDGLLVSKGKPNGYIRTEKKFANYVLTVEQRHVVKGNGGILIGITGEDKIWPHCIEVQGAAGSIGDFWNQGHIKMNIDPARKDPKDKTDRHIFRIAPTSEKPVGEWNLVEVTVDHGNLVVKVNEQVQQLATEVDDLNGQIGLQAEGGPMEFRKIEIRPID